MLFSVILPVISAFSGISFAQTIDPNSVDSGTKEQWCKQQKTSCPLLCLQYPGNNAGTESNDCDPDTLSYSCVCWNGRTPNASEYSETVPFFECQEFGNQCVDACGNDASCANDCRVNNPCGAQEPTRVNTSTITTSHPKTTSGSRSGSSGTGAASTDAFATFGSGGSEETGSSSSGDGSDANGDSSAGALAIDMGRTYGMVVVLGGVFAGAMLVL